MEIVEITKNDFKSFWPTFKEIVEAQETYAFNPNMTFEEAYTLWCKSAQQTFVMIDNNIILGSYYIKQNSSGPSSHISNCGYMVSPSSRGKGVAKALCIHSQKIALELGYLAMQFNSVVSSNEIAINLWKKLGYDVIGTIPNAYNHKTLGYVDSFIMYKKLKELIPIQKDN